MTTPERHSHSSQKYLRTPDAATYIGLGKSTLEKLRVTGTGPRYHKLGGAVVYDTVDLDAWIAARTQVSTAENPHRRGPGRPRKNPPPPSADSLADPATYDVPSELEWPTPAGAYGAATKSTPSPRSGPVPRGTNCSPPFRGER